MDKYHKILTLFRRDPEQNYKYVIEGDYASPYFRYLRDDRWIFTEKIDGTNIRVQYRPYMEVGNRIKFRGKTDNAQTPPFLLEKLGEIFTQDVFDASFPDIGEVDVCLYGEGYGAKIQKGGGNYIPDGVNFILFDVMINEIWLAREDVVDIAAKMGLDVVPIVGAGPIRRAVDICKNGAMSHISNTPIIMEGLVMRPEYELMDRLGRRIITKLKYKDFNRIVYP